MAFIAGHAFAQGNGPQNPRYYQMPYYYLDEPDALDVWNSPLFKPDTMIILGGLSGEDLRFIRYKSGGFYRPYRHEQQDGTTRKVILRH